MPGIPALWLIGLFPGPVSHRLQDLVLGGAALHSALCASVRPGCTACRFRGIHFSGYAYLFTDPLYLRSYLYSVMVAAVSTLCCLLLGYPMAYAIARSGEARRNVLLMLIMLPFWTSFLLRVYAWIGLLKNDGIINNVLLHLGLIHQPHHDAQTDFALYLGIVYSYLPFMILPLYANLEKHDAALLEAAADLGARP